MESNLAQYPSESQFKANGCAYTGLQRCVDELAAITALTREVTSKLSLKQMIASTYRLIHTMVTPDLIVIYLKRGNKLILQEMEEDKSKVVPDGMQSRIVGECLCGIAARTGKPSYSTTMEDNPCCTMDRCINLGMQSFAALPLIIENQILGVLGIASRASRNFSEQSCFLETIASQIAICLHNSILYETIQKHADDLEKMLHEKNQAAAALRKREKQLELNSKNLEEVNMALKVLLKQRDEDKAEFEEKVIFNFKELVLPYLEKLKSGKLNSLQTEYVNVLESNLNEIISPFVHNLSSNYYGLTPKELQVADLIKKGKTTKEIAAMLNSSTRVIHFHRNSLRKKFGLTNKKVNLRSHFLTLT